MFFLKRILSFCVTCQYAAEMILFFMNTCESLNSNLSCHAKFIFHVIEISMGRDLVKGKQEAYMTIRHLKIFIAVAETGKMSLAAKKLYLAQPTISQAIHELELG